MLPFSLLKWRGSAGLRPTKMILPTKHGFSLKVTEGSYFAGVLQKTQSYEDVETSLVARLVRSGDFCVDAGCYVGYYACFMAQRGARVLAVDANPGMYELAKSNVALNRFEDRVQVLHAALADREYDAEFHLPSQFDDGWGSLAAADDAGRGDIQVPARLLRNLLQQHTGRIRLIKMDIEGAELLALRGLGDRIQDVDFLLVECIDIPARMWLGSSASGISQLLVQEFGFQAWRYRRARWPFRKAGWKPVRTVTSRGDHSYLFVNPGVAMQL
jgi:FkbM family methyltransferase